jgi:hypothetical protein
MKMKALLLAAAFLPLAAAAQETSKERKDDVSRAEKVEMRTEEMVQQLGLNADQATKLKEINDRYAAEMKETRPEDGAPTARRTRMEDIRKRRDVELKALLTEDQFSRMLELRKEAQGERPARK